MFKKKKQYLFKFKDVYGKERYATVKVECESDATWKFINNRCFFRLNLECEYEAIGEIKAI